MLVKLKDDKTKKDLAEQEAQAEQARIDAEQGIVSGMYKFNYVFIFLSYFQLYMFSSHSFVNAYNFDLQFHPPSKYQPSGQCKGKFTRMKLGKRSSH